MTTGRTGSKTSRSDDHSTALAFTGLSRVVSRLVEEDDDLLPLKILVWSNLIGYVKKKIFLYVFYILKQNTQEEKITTCVNMNYTLKNRLTLQNY